MKKIELIYDKYGFCLGERTTITRTVRRKVKSQNVKRRYTEAEHKEATKRLIESLENAYKQAKETGQDICISRNGVEVVPYKPGREIFY